jgi:hypothetical protein
MSSVPAQAVALVVHETERSRRGRGNEAKTQRLRSRARDFVTLGDGKYLEVTPCSRLIWTNEEGGDAGQIKLEEFVVTRAAT